MHVLAQRPERNAPPREGYFAQLHASPHLHDGPHLQALSWVAHLHVGAQVHGLHVHFLIMVNSIVRLVEFI